ncbi:lytic transglycosylase domain-containing protein [Thioalkalivibrio paradoxus]|uniref:Lytic transglycosylase n=1 Tax=Thioalkalivibrio paradoxus ARh 1 TaxID=713585 RepID=W0DIY5_9GAMM|nr:lytic transglycosylase domain-containing protein [Thioalkalivibrio paradoxus]AHE97182.1 lytic transglycosylase [Thioalkalivibrio paradoxus ARh 1]
MSDVRFSADPSSVLRAMQDIQRAIQRAGQEGKAFSEMDLSHPELKDLERDMARLRSSMLALQRISPGSQFARGLKQSGQAGMDPWAVDWRRAFPEQQQRDKALHRLVQGSGHAYGGDGGQRPPGGGGFAAPMGGSLGTLARTALPIAMGGGLVASLMRGLREADQTSEATDTLMRYDELGRTFDELRDSVTGLLTQFGLANAEAARLAEGYARASGEVEGATDAVKDSVALARGLGMNAEGTTRAFGSLQFSGVFDRQDRREFATMLAEMIGRSGMYARGDELLGQVTRMADRVWEATLEAPNTRAIMEAYSAMFDVSAATGKTALKGGAGERILAAADAGVRNIGGGEAGEFFMYRALSGVTGDIYKQRYLRDYGAFGTPGQAFGGDDNRTLLQIVMDQFRRDAKNLNNPYASYSALGGFFNISSRQAEAMMAVDKQMRQSGLGNMQSLLEQSGVDLSEMDASGLGQIAKIIEEARAAGPVNVEDVADAIRRAAEEGRIQTVASESNREMARLSDQLEQLMRDARPLLTNLTGYLADGVGVVNDLIGEIKQVNENLAWIRNRLGFSPLQAPEGVPPAQSAIMEQMMRLPLSLWQGRRSALDWMRERFSREDKPESSEPEPSGGLGRIGPGIIPWSDLHTVGPEIGLTDGIPSRAAMERVDAHYNLPRGTIWALTRTESNHDPNAVSHAGAMGIAQFMPGTARDMGLNDPFDPYASIEAAGRYMRHLLDQPYIHTLQDALASYNAGPGNFRDRGAYYWREPTEHRERFERHFSAYQRDNPDPVNVVVHVHPQPDGPPEVEVEVDGRVRDTSVGEGAYHLSDFAFGAG